MYSFLLIYLKNKMYIHYNAKVWWSVHFFFKELCSIKNHEEKKIEFSEHLWSAHIM